MARACGREVPVGCHMMHPGVRKQALDMQSRFEIDQINLYTAIKKVRKGCWVCQACNPDNRNVKGVKGVAGDHARHPP